MRFYTVAELSELLHLSQSQIYGHIEDGTLGAHRFTRKRSGALRVSQEQLDEFLRATEVKHEPAAEPERTVVPPRKGSAGGTDLW